MRSIILSPSKPCRSLCALRKNLLRDEEFSEVFGHLYDSYRPDFLWWSVFVIGHSMLMVMIKVLFQENLFQGPIAIGLNFLVIWAYSRYISCIHLTRILCAISGS